MSGLHRTLSRCRCWKKTWGVKQHCWWLNAAMEDLRNEALVECMAMSPRNFARVFREETGMIPAKFVEKARLDCARQLSGESDRRIETVAVEAGFSDYERMRRAFVRNLGITPQEYRNRFNRSGPRPVPVMTRRRVEKVFESLSQL